MSLDHYNEALRIDEVAALATMSASSFHHHFRAVTSMTPIQTVLASTSSATSKHTRFVHRETVS